MLGVGLSINAIQQGSSIASGDFTATSEIDPLNGAYTFNGEMVALGDIMDVTTPAFDPATDIDAGGMKPRDDGGIGAPFIGDLLASMIGGFTVKLEVFVGSGVNVRVETSSDADGSDPYAACLVLLDPNEPDPDLAYIERLDAVDFERLTLAEPIVADSTIKVAVTFASDRMAFSMNGGAVSVLPNPGIDPGTTWVDFTLNTGGEVKDARVRKFAILPVQDDADLPALTS